MNAAEAYFTEVPKVIFSMTFTGSILSFFLFILKPLIKDKLPRSFQYYMWMPAVITLLLPVSKIIVIPVSDYPVTPMKPMDSIVRWISDTVFENPADPAFAPQNENGQSVRQAHDFSGTAVILSVVWQLGMILVLCFHIICYVSYVRKLDRHNISAGLQETALLDDLLERKNTLRLYKNAMVKTPVLIGFFRLAVILPDKEYGEVQLRNILLHEIMHRKRHDIFVKWLLIFAGAVHWFNPLVYFVCREMDKACELACDEAVIKRFDRNEMQQYGDTLIAVAADSIGKMPLSTAMLEDKKNLKERLGAIMKYQKYSKRTVIVSGVVFAAAVCAVLWFSTLYGSVRGKEDNMDNFSKEDQMSIKEIELKKVLWDYDRENIVSLGVSINYLDEEITRAYIAVIGREKDPDSETLSEMRSAASEELALDISNICLTYVDSETFTLRESLGE